MRRTRNESRGLWRQGRIVSAGVERPHKPLRFVLATIAALLFVDTLLAIALPAPDPTTYAALEGSSDVRAVLRRAAGAEQPWLLIGDSVLAGDVMEGRVPDWKQRRVVDYMRSELALGDATSFHQIALNGMLLVDIERVVIELDRTDPGGKVPVLVEINPRYLSRHYGEQTDCTRDWLCELGVPLLGGKGVLWGAWAKMTAVAGKRWVLSWMPIVRHREKISLAFRPEQALAPEAELKEVDPLAALARLTQHYRDPDLRRDSTQLHALRRTVRHLRAAGRRAVFFTTPVEDEFLAHATTQPAYGELIAALSSIIDDPDDPSVSLVNLDHPSFTSPLFIDHCHLLPAGNRQLATNLLHELNLGLARAPVRAEIAHPEGVDTTLVARVRRGYSDGAAWQAQLDRPKGIAVEQGRRRVVIADTGNNVLRELRGNMQTLRTIAGRPKSTADPGRRYGDGPAEEVNLRAPQSPAFFGDTVYFSDNKRRKLRGLRSGRVRTEHAVQGPQWRRINAIRSTQQGLYLLDDGRRILRYEPVPQRTTELVTAARELEIQAFDVAEDGRIFVVDSNGNIWETATKKSARVGPGSEAATLLFANTARTILPEKIRAFFPYRFDEVGLRNVVDVRYVERYGGLLVQDDVPYRKKMRGLTERIHLRLFDLDDERVYPWIRPLVFGGGHILHNKKAGSKVTRFHLGSMALDQSTASLFYLERERSRLVRMSDGLLGVALVGNTPSKRTFNGTREFFGNAAGDAALANHQPDRFFDARWERLPRGGPYVGLLIGSSMIGASDMVGMYSLGRGLERRLQDMLGYRDRVRFDMFVRSATGASARDVADYVELFVESSPRPDVILFEVRATQGFSTGLDTDEALIEQLLRIQEGAARAGALLVAFDSTSLVSMRRDGLRVGKKVYSRRADLVAQAGIMVIDLSDLLLEDHWLVSPWGSPPFALHHASPWAIDATADRLAAALYPYISEHLRGRVPARTLEPEPDLREKRAPLGPTFDEYDVAWAETLPAVTAGEMQRSYSRGRLELFVDLGGLEDGLPLAHAALACVYSALTRDAVSGSASEIRIRLAHFDNYDEYGRGVLEAADVRYDRTLDHEALRALIEEVVVVSTR